MDQVSIVLTTCDYGRFLERCLTSLLHQTQLPDSVVIVDDASVDDTRDVLARLMPTLEPRFPVTVIQHDQRLGFAASLNDGVAATATPLFAHVDADDVCLPRYVEALAEALDRHPEAAYAYPRLRLTGAETGVYRSFDFHPARLLFEGNYIPNVAMVRRDAFDETGGYRQLPTHVDWDLWLAMLERGHHGVLVDEVLYEWYRHPGAMTYQSRATRLRTRGGIMLRHRRAVVRNLHLAVPWTVRAAGRRLGLTRERRSASGWLEP